MNNVLAWVKSNLIIVASAVVMLLVLPTSWFFASRWNNSLRTSAEAAGNADLKKIQGVREVTYSLPPILPDGQAVTLRAAPNARITEFFRERRTKNQAMAVEVVKLAEEINKAGHRLLMEGLFPSPERGQADIMRADFAKLMIPKRDARNPSPYEKLLRSINAGGPPDLRELALSIGDAEQGVRERMLGEKGAGGQLASEDLAVLRKELLEKRLAAVQAQAQNVSLYADMTIFPMTGDESPGVPRAEPERPPSLLVSWIWQHDYWVVSDVLAAVAKANRGPGGNLTPVEQSVVKRIESIRMDTHPARSGTAVNTEEEEIVVEGETPPVIGPEGQDVRKSLTGRHTNPKNTVFDVRTVTLRAIVSSARLPVLIDAINSTNLMQVVGLNLSSVDVRSELDAGYFYGSEHVVSAEVKIETIWLRSWMKPMMPPSVRNNLGIPADEPAPDAEGAAPEGEAGGPR